ncbi:MAG TPA: VIT1/CCC1 transporter family protein [Gammaproteobacteria bacterium]|jgi:VIT1/CCC1 family predicted Fe2+/Mn2+ transporter|nr:VIT1/CCC1 transporter family protein [Gammaproteobacteria bacterium]
MEIYDNWYEEKRSAYLYSIMAEHEKNVLHKKLFTDLKVVAEKQAAIWQKKILEQQLPPPVFTPDLRSCIIIWLIKHLGSENIRPILSAMKIRGMSVFSELHSEHRHTSFNAASNLRAAVFGINDGLISNMSLILGVAGAQASPHFIILAGVAGLLAGACSMGAGEYISVRSQREVFEYQIAIEEQELKEYPEEETEELSLIYQARGVPLEEADHLAKLMIKNPKTGLNALAREELGINPDDLVSPIGAMLSSFFSFAIGAGIPLLPFLFSHSNMSLYISIVATGITLFLIGALLSLFTNRNPWLNGLRMLCIGAVAGGLTFMIGRWLDVTLT